MKIIDMIRKLFAKAESAHEIGSVEEAATFAAKANELLLKHKIAPAELALDDEEDADPLGRDDLGGDDWDVTTAKWSRNLANAVAVTHFCTLVRMSSTGKAYALFGSDSDREIVKYMVAMLSKEAQRQVKVYLTAENYPSWERTKARTSFLLGFVQAVYVRLKAQRGQAEAAGGQYAVVRLRDVEKTVRAYAASSVGGLTTTRSRSTRTIGSAYGAGQSAGASVGLNHGVRSGTRAVRMLGSGS